MRKRIFRNTALLVIISIVLTFLAMGLVMYNRTYEQMRDNVENECEYLKASLDESGTEFLTANIVRISGSRVTLIDTDGTVLFDSAESAENMENHLERPEVQEAPRTPRNCLSGCLTVSSPARRTCPEYTAGRLRWAL